MKNLLRLSISILFILALFTMNDCKKNADEENGPDKKALLTSHIWKFDNLSSTNPLVQIYINSLSIDNATVNFDAAGTYTGSMTGQSENGSWEFNVGETSIIIDKGTDYETEGIIVRLTSDVLELNIPSYPTNFGNFPVTIKLKR